ncbi:membrane protein [Modestobacter marinus]|uniref:Membrane protein n=1 Tax=Modestobacter marinus TaxID=477641 RepID=A0A846LYT7_9ACTN|nr:DoxX family membrane protein [Modestobacter marinus]NIH68589.1 putative membrane protein [Modestobacter marinus]GGL58440.1 membrane protein [Modestobacter marinus]
MPDQTRLRSIARIALGSTLVFAGTSHLTFAREEFRAQVPPWVPLDVDDVVLMSGVVEVGLGAILVGLPREQRRIGALAAAFFTAIAPGNIAQYTQHRDAFGLDTDTKRALRLLGQPVLVAWAWWSTRTRTP